MCTPPKTANSIRERFNEKLDRDPFWWVLSVAMCVGAYLHMCRVVAGWRTYQECQETRTMDNTGTELQDLGRGAELMAGALGPCFYPGMWKVIHFTGGVIWMFGGLLQLMLFKYSKGHPQLIRLHRVLGKFMCLNAIFPVAIVGLYEATAHLLNEFTFRCTVPAIVGGVPAVLAVTAFKEQLGCPQHQFMPCFLYWATSGDIAMYVHLYKTARGGPSRRHEHMAWGLFIAGFGCFDSVNYLIKHLFMYLDWFEHDALYHYVVTPTPFVFIMLLLYKTELNQLYRLKDIWASILFTFMHVKAYTGDWITPAEKSSAGVTQK